mmetsp:Transcript_9342/g.24152  ORF Transcript_9342/g.24152 Transcript_9342/m.24152 type:complete len:249 (-) Transcript_9342:534-1280(-)
MPGRHCAEELPSCRWAWWTLPQSLVPADTVSSHMPRPAASHQQRTARSRSPATATRHGHTAQRRPPPTSAELPPVVAVAAVAELGRWLVRRARLLLGVLGLLASALWAFEETVGELAVLVRIPLVGLLVHELHLLVLGDLFAPLLGLRGRHLLGVHHDELLGRDRATEHTRYELRVLAVLEVEEERAKLVLISGRGPAKLCVHDRLDLPGESVGVHALELVGRELVLVRAADHVAEDPRELLQGTRAH